MKCPNCGTETDSKFCPNCGADLTKLRGAQEDSGSGTYGGSSQQISRSGQPYNTQNGTAGNGQPYNTQNGPAGSGQPYTYESVPQMNTRPPKKKISGLSIIAFIFSFFGRAAFIGIILAVIDLVRRDRTKKHGLSVAAIIIGLIIGVASVSGGGSSSTDDGTSSEISTAAEESADHTDSASLSEQTESESTDEISEPSSATEAQSSENEAEESEQKEEPAEVQETSKEEFIASCQELNYKEIARNPDQYEGQNFVFTCYVMSAREGGLFSGYQKYYVTYAFDQEKSDEYAGNPYVDADDTDTIKMAGVDYDTCVWLMDNRDEKSADYQKVLEGDVIRVYGTFTGMTETQNSLTGESGEEVSLDMKYVDLVME